MRILAGRAARRLMQPRRRTVFRLSMLSAFCLMTLVVGLVVRSRVSALPELRTVNIAHRDLRITIGTTGTIEPEEIVQVGPEVAGKIVSFGYDSETPGKPIGVGSRVTKGAVLFQLDREIYEIELQKTQVAYRVAEAEIGRLEAHFRQADRNLKRAERLRSTNAQREYDAVVAAYEMASAQMAIGRVRLEQVAVELKHIEIRLEKTTVRSPTDGVVIDRRANLGQHVHVGHPGLFLIAKDLNQMRIRASVSESDIGRVKLGQTVTFSVDAHRDKTLTGHVDEILLNARTHGNFVTYDVLVAIDDTETTLFPHMTADVEFEIVKRENVWLVPNTALQWQPADEQIMPRDGEPTRSENVRGHVDDGKKSVWVLAENGKVRPIPVDVGIDDGVLTEVVGDGFREDLPVVVGVVKKTKLARIIPSAKTRR